MGKKSRTRTASKIKPFRAEEVVFVMRAQRKRKIRWEKGCEQIWDPFATIREKIKAP